MPNAHSPRRVWREKKKYKWRQQKRQISKQGTRKRKRGGGGGRGEGRPDQSGACRRRSPPSSQRFHFLHSRGPSFETPSLHGCAAITSLAGQARPTRQSGLEEGTTQTTPGKAAVTLNTSPAVLPEEKSRWPCEGQDPSLTADRLCGLWLGATSTLF